MVHGYRQGRSSVAVLVAGLVAALSGGSPPPSASPAEPGPDGRQRRVVTVDCSDGAGLNAALRRTSASTGDREWIFEIRGTCRENVVLDQRQVTLRGRDPASDGIHGVGPDDGRDTAVVTIAGGRRIRLENLSVTGGTRNGLVVLGTTDAELSNCWVADNGRYGLWVGQAATLLVESSRIFGNGRGGLVASGGAHLTCVECGIDDEGLFALWTQLGARAVFRRSELESATNWAVVGYASSEISMQDSRISGRPYALVTRSHDGVRLTRVELTGAVWLDAKSSLELFDATQMSNPTVNLVVEDSVVRLDHGSSMTGPSILEDFASLSIRGDSTHSGDLYCNSGSDAFCEHEGMVDGSASGCAHCVVPPAAVTAPERPAPAANAAVPGTHLLEPLRR